MGVCGGEPEGQGCVSFLYWLVLFPLETMLVEMITLSLPLLRCLAIYPVYCTVAMVVQCSKTGADRASLDGVANLRGLARIGMVFCNLAGADRASQVLAKMMLMMFCNLAGADRVDV